MQGPGFQSSLRPRVSTTKIEKLALLGLALGDVAATRIITRETPRKHLWQRS